ncbi:MAG: HPr-rel-A system PqqD family peptide chaperone [Actinomycetota bacterium]
MSEHGAHDQDSASTGNLQVAGTYVPRRAADVLELDMEDGLVVYNHDSSLVHHLNPSAALVWRICDGEASVAQLSAEVAEEYGLVRQNVQRELQSLVAEFDALGLVEDAALPNG